MVQLNEGINMSYGSVGHLPEVLERFMIHMHVVLLYLSIFQPMYLLCSYNKLFINFATLQNVDTV